MKQEDIDRLPLITREVLARVEANAARKRAEAERARIVEEVVEWLNSPSDPPEMGE